MQQCWYHPANVHVSGIFFLLIEIRTIASWSGSGNFGIWAADAKGLRLGTFITFGQSEAKGQDPDSHAESEVQQIVFSTKSKIQNLPCA